jgi:hypothetical protein
MRLPYVLLAATVLVLVTGLANGAGLRTPTTPRATAEFIVQNTQPYILQPLPCDVRDVAVMRETYRVRVKSSDVLGSVLADPKVRVIEAITKQDNAIEWLKERVIAEFDGESELFEVGIASDELSEDELVVVADAIVNAFLNNVVDRERIQRSSIRDTLNKNRLELDEEIRGYLTQIAELKNNPAENGIDIQILEHELEYKWKLSQRLGEAIDIWDMELTADYRIQQLAKASLKTSKPAN